MESLEVINQRLIDHYGYFESGNKANWRVVFSANETIIQNSGLEGFNIFSREGIFIRKEFGFKELPKYPYIKPPKYILERLIPTGSDELEPIIYECHWAFGLYGDPYGEPIEPNWIAIKFLIDKILETQYYAIHGRAKYKDPEEGYGTPEYVERKRVELDEIYLALYGDETKVGDALAYGTGVTVPNNYPNKE